MPVGRFAAAVCVIIFTALAAPPALAQPVYEQIHAFQEIPHYLTGRLVEGPDGTLYGAARVPGAGAIVKFVPQPDGTLLPSTLYRFAGEGAGPNGGLVFASDGNIYGTTCQAGPAEAGTIFRCRPPGSSR